MEYTCHASCLLCEHGKFQPFNGFMGTTCRPWKSCNSSEITLVNGTNLIDRVCSAILTATLAPTTTMAVTQSTTAATTQSTTQSTTTVATTQSTTTAAPVVAMQTTKPKHPNRSRVDKKLEGEEEKLSAATAKPFCFLAQIIMTIVYLAWCA